MSEMRGYLIAYKDGDIDLDEMEEKIIKFGFKEMRTGYDNGYIDGRIKRIEKPRSDLLRAVRSVELTTIGTSVRGELFEQLKGANKVAMVTVKDTCPRKIMFSSGYMVDKMACESCKAFEPKEE